MREEKKRENQIRNSLFIYLFICMFGSKNKMETLLLMLSTSRKTKKSTLL